MVVTDGGGRRLIQTGNKRAEEHERWTMARLSGLSVAALTLVGGSVIGVSSISAGATGRAAHPHITAHPRSVMVNHTTKLIGTNFKSKKSITIKECSETTWIVPQDPCGTNSIVVKTNRYGGFTSSFTVQTCPGGTNTGPSFSEKCFIGDPTPSGIDVISLVGATKITVTGP